MSQSINNQYKDYKVLFIKDEKYTSQYITHSLSYFVAEVKEASCEEEAIKIMQSFSPDMIITNLVLSKINGIDFIKPENFKNLLTVLQKYTIIKKRDKNLYHPIFKEYVYNSEEKVFSYNTQKIKLTKKEILLIELLFKNNSRVVTYREVENYVWRENVMTDCAIRTLVKNLRKKLPYNLIENLSGVGYKLA